MTAGSRPACRYLGLSTVWELGFGHCARALTVPLGVTAEQDADVGTLTLDKPALR